MATGPGLYSRMVTVLKVGLPLVALAMLAGLFLISEDGGRRGELVFTPADLAALGDGMRVRDPIFSGVTDRDDRFRFTADEVTPDAAPPTRADIVALTGRIDFAGGRGVDLRSDAAALDLETQQMGLTGDVRVTTSDGYDLAARQVDLDLRGGGIRAEGAVSGRGPMGDIAAARLTVSPPADRSGERTFLFENNVRLIYDPPDAGD